MKDKNKHTSHKLSDLPLKGFGANMDSIGIDEPVIIKMSEMLNTIFWEFTIKAIQDRAKKLDAFIYWERDLESSIMWFSKPKKI